MAIYSYGPYGEPNVTTGVRFRYTGQQYLGGLNLYYYKARFYSPALGRFLQTDPIGTRDDLNLYAYVGNNPVNFSDPTGLASAEIALISKNFASGYFDTRSVMEAPSTAADVGAVTRSVVDTGVEVVAYGLIAFDIANTFTVVGAGPDTGLLGAALLVTTRRGGESAAAAVGRRAHGNYGTALGERFDTKVTLPSGKKPDAVNWGRREVRELKPDNARAVARGERQVEGYRKELETVTGEPWTSVVDVYRAGK
nr:RHS repeat-associated core domain-containing protein [Ectothiorhodospira lacustris]